MSSASWTSPPAFPDVCLIAFAWQADARWPLVVAANRDEYFARPTASADWWDDGEVLAGRDLRAGGTWMGVARRGRFAALTNHRDPRAQRADAPSRGAVVADFLTTTEEPDAAVARIAATADRYNGFNLIAAQWSRADAGLWIVAHPAATTAQRVAPGLHGLSNAHLDTPWPKVRHATAGMRAALADASDVDGLADALFAVLADTTVAPDERLPDTGISRETERALSASFIRMPGYGTRASTVLVVDATGHATLIERRLEPDAPAEQRRFAFATGGADRAVADDCVSAVRDA